VSADQGTVEGDLFFEARVPTVDSYGSIVLEEVSQFPGAGMLAMVFDVQGNVVGGAQVDDEGHFTVPLSRPPSEDDTLMFVTVWAPSLQSDVAPLAVGQSDAGGQAAPGNIVPWAWQVSTPPDGYVGAVTIAEDEGSGAIYLFLFTKLAMQTILWDILGGNESGLATLAIVWAPGLAWDCGACFGQGFTQNMDGTMFDNSIFISGEEGDSSAWGWAVILHEFGHYVARSYSRDDSPGGSHFIGVPVVPSFAWSEGFASFFAVSTMSRWFGQPVSLYWDIQQGSSFWVDYAVMSTSSSLVAPDPEGGMEQDLDENWVAAALWDLWDGKDVAESESPQDGTALGTEIVIAAVASDRFLQGDRGAEGADLVDFIDTVVSGLPSMAGDIVGTVVNHLGFPYEGEGAAQAARAPISLTVERIGSGTGVELLAVVTASGRAPAPVVLVAVPREGTRLESGAESEDLGRLEPGSRVERKFRISGTDPTVVIRAVSRSEEAAATAVASWPAQERLELKPSEAAPIPPVKIGGVVIREAIPLESGDVPREGEAGHAP
jgi:hypothetical protein